MNKLLLAFIIGVPLHSGGATLTLEELQRSVLERHPVLEAAEDRPVP